MRFDPPTLHFRGARLSDAARVARCFVASRRHLGVHAVPASDGEVEAWVASSLLPTGGVTVALEAGAVVGFIAISERADGHWVDQLHVHPLRLRRGIGSMLLHVALSRREGPVRLYTLEPDRAARRFYEGHGFTMVGLGESSANDSRFPDVLYERHAPMA